MLAESFPKRYVNPVYPHSFPDPFVLKFRGEYYAYCTDFAPDGKVFNVLRSRDLVNWRETGGAMERLNNDSPFYWAPEVFYHNGKFYLYYSVGNEALMEVRVAESVRPDGGFTDAGHRLTSEEFAIDAHVFADADGARYLFYATDFLAHTHIGTGTVVDRMLDPFTLEGKPQPVTRAKYDWQIYDPNRKEKGGVRWHTVEGPTVLKRKNVYYEMFSGGNWQNTTYGVSFAVADSLKQTDEWQQFSDGETVFPILRTIPELIVGPGHNSVVRGLNNRELYCVYHRWTENGRVLAIDRMDFAGGNRIFINGATHTPQPAPYEPKISDFFDEFSERNWQAVSGEWRAEENQLIAGDAAANLNKNEIVSREVAQSFACEVYLKTLEYYSGRYGITLKNGAENVSEFWLVPAEKQAVTVWSVNNTKRTEIFRLSDDFDFAAFHLLRVEVDERFVLIILDQHAARFERTIQKRATQIAIVSEQAAAFSGFSLTEGFEELFENNELTAKGWRRDSQNDDFKLENGHLILESVDQAPTVISKLFEKTTDENYELAVNFCLKEFFGDNSTLEFHPVVLNNEQAPYFSLENKENVWILKAVNAAESIEIALPPRFEPEFFHQIRFIKMNGKIFVALETETLGSIDASPRSGGIAFSARNVAVHLEMVRLTFL